MDVLFHSIPEPGLREENPERPFLESWVNSGQLEVLSGTLKRAEVGDTDVRVIQLEVI